jgi:hypothetical protein
MERLEKTRKRHERKGLSCAPGKNYTVFVAIPIILQISMWT